LGQAEQEFGDLDEVLRAAVRLSPDPPRPSSVARLLRVSYKSITGKSMVGVALVLGAPATVIEILASLHDVGHVPLAIFAVLFTAFLLAVPAVPARRASRALREGVRALAEVTELRHAPPGRVTTIDSVSHGFASGRWRVDHPQGAFEKSFQTDSTWADELRVGSVVLLLVDPNRPSILVDLGPADGVLPPR
jgi:hypothetical protein